MLRSITFLIGWFVILLHALIVSAQPPAISWSQTYGDEFNDYAWCVQQTNDNGYIMVGSTTVDESHLDIYLIKTDPLGITEWTQIFGMEQATDEYGRSVRQTSDGGYIIAGWTHTWSGRCTDIWLIRTDSLGDTLWTKIHGGTNYDFAYCVEQTADEGYIITGYTGSYGALNHDVLLIRTDPQGNEEWTQTYGAWGDDAGYCVQQTSDLGYVVTGLKAYPNGSVWLIRTASNGFMMWDNTWGGSADDRGFSVRQTDDDGFIIAGQTNSFGAGNYDVYVIRTDDEGETEWENTYGGANLDIGNCIQRTEDGGIVVAGTTESFGLNGANVYLLKIHYNTGDLIWSDAMGGDGYDEGQYVCYDIQLFKTEADPPYPPVFAHLTPHNPPITIPAVGGSFLYDLEIVNDGPDTYTIDFWIDVTLTNGTIYPIEIRENRPLNANSTISRNNLIQNVPGTALPGIYYYNFHVRDNSTWEVYDETSFSFEKLPGDDAPSPDYDWTLFGLDDETVQISSPDAFALYPAHPNPFNPTTVIAYQLPSNSFVNLSVYDVSGRKVTELVNGWRLAGRHEVNFDAIDLPSGVYLYRIKAGEFNASNKMILVK
jgi:hypothetical protein